MPIDPSIPLSIRPPAPMPSLVDTVQQLTQLQALKSAGEERRAAAQEAQAKRQREAQIEAAMREAVTIDPQTQQPTIDYAKLLPHVPPAALFAVKKEIDATSEQMVRLQTANLTQAEKVASYLGGVARGVRAAGDDPQAFQLAVVGAKKVGALSAAEADALLDAVEQNPAAATQWTDRAIAAAGGTAAPKLAQIQTMEGGVAGTRFVPEEAGTFYPSVPKASDTAAVGSFEDYVVRRFGSAPTAEQITQARKDYQQADDRPRITVNTGQRPITQTAEAGLISRLNSQWTTATKSPRELQQQLTTMRAGLAAAERGDMAQGTEAVLQPFLKILDPNSVVREGEFFRLREGQSYIARAKGIMQRLTQGGFVPLAELKKYAALAEEIAKRQDSYVAGVRGRIGQVADRYSIPQELVFEGAAPIQDTSTTPSGGGGGAAGLTYQDYQRAKGK